MGKKNTSYSVTSNLIELQKEYIVKTGIPSTVLHKRAIEALYESDNWNILPELRVHKRAPGRLIRDAKLRVYMDDEMEAMLQELAQYNKCDRSSAFFHALLMYVTQALTSPQITIP